MLKPPNWAVFVWLDTGKNIDIIILLFSRKNNVAKGKSYTTELFKQRLFEIYKTEAPFINSEYVSNEVDTIIICHKHGIVPVTPKQLLYSSKNFYCPKCGTENRINQGAISKKLNAARTFVDRAIKVHGDKYTYDNVVYTKSSEKVLITCPAHGDFPQTPSEHLQGSGCKKCANEQNAKRNLKPFEVFVEEANNIHDHKYTYDDSTYLGARILTRVICKDHGEFWVTPDNHLSKQSGCPNCVHQISSHEDRLYKVFNSFDRTNRSVIAPYHLDLYSQEHHLAIEVNGRYWHSEERGKTQNYHVDKTEKCLSKGVSLLHFWDDEIDNKFDIVCSMVNSRIGNTNPVYARGLTVKEIGFSITKFLNENHLQGDSNHSVAFGLFEGDELISAMTFAKPRFSAESEWEIIRFATKLNTRVIGGASKLFKAFIRTYSPNSVLTYADRRYSEGKVYEKLGFEFSHNSKPSYFYTNGGTNVSRYAAQKHKLSKLLGDKFKLELSESENMLAAGYNKVYDCGNKVFIWKGTL